MIDCRTCIHWDEFDSEVTHMRRVDDPSEPEYGIDFEFEKEVFRVETCAKGLSPMEDGKTIGQTVERCRAYFPGPVQIELPMRMMR